MSSRSRSRLLALLLAPVLAVTVAMAPAQARPHRTPVVDRSADPVSGRPGSEAVSHVDKLPLGDAARAERRRQKTLKAKLTVDTTVSVGAPTKFETRGSRAKRGLRSLTIVFGDGARARGSRLRTVRTHTYAKEGMYLAKLVIKDRTGRKATDKKNVLVTVKGGAGDSLFGAAPPDPGQEVSIDPDTAPGAGAGAPASVDMRPNTVAVGSQAPLNSCVAWATGYAMMGYYWKQKYAQSVAFAPMYLYSQTYLGLDANGQPKGSYASSALDVLYKQGIDTAYHYGSGWATGWNVRPNAAQVANAANYRISGYNQLFRHATGWTDASVGTTTTELEAIKERLAAGNPVALAIRTRTDFGTPHQTGWYTASGAQNAGGGLHEVLAVGYDATGLYIQNSWGTDRGVDGFVYMTWAAAQKDVYEAMFAYGLVAAGGGGGGDTTKPTINSFSKNFGAGYVANNSQAPVTFNWSGSDNVGVSKYVLYYRTGASDWYELAINPTQTSATYNLAFDSSYEFAIGAYDAAGNLSQWSLSGVFTPRNYTESVGSYTGSWFYYDNAAFMNGRLFESSQTNAYMEVQVNSTTNFGLVATKGPSYGRAFVYVDGAYSFTIDAYSAYEIDRAVVGWVSFGSASTHVIRVVLEGTAGRPYFDVDSVLII